MPILARDNYWILETEHTAYACGVGAQGLPEHVYWGARLPFAGD